MVFWEACRPYGWSMDEEIRIVARAVAWDERITDRAMEARENSENVTIITE
jgi:hypothetical protein